MKELRRGGVGIVGTGHGDGVGVVLEAVPGFVDHGLAGVGLFLHVGGMAAALNHEAGDDAMEGQSVIEIAVGKRNEVADALRRLFRIQLAVDEGAVVHGDGEGRVLVNLLNGGSQSRVVHSQSRVAVQIGQFLVVDVALDFRADHCDERIVFAVHAKSCRGYRATRPPSGLQPRRRSACQSAAHPQTRSRKPPSLRRLRRHIHDTAHSGRRSAYPPHQESG